MTITPSKETIDSVIDAILTEYHRTWLSGECERNAMRKAAFTAVMQSKEVRELVDAAQRLLNERDRMVVSGDYNSLAGVSHILRVALRPFTPTNEAEDE